MSHPEREDAPWHLLPALARRAIAAHLGGEPFEAPSLPAPMDAPVGVFVTLWAPGHRLRGCIGHVEPFSDSLAEEVALCAVSAATRDPRFPRVTPAELGDLHLEISLLHPPEPVSGLDELDPQVYGVVVSSGRRRGVLLAGVDGVRDAAHQVDIARQKAGIGPREPFAVERFPMTKIEEARGPAA